MLALIFGLIIGISLGLTGGGGSILAVPMLVHGLGMDARAAAGVSLAAVGATALVGAIERIVKREIDLAVGFLFALAGMFARGGRDRPQAHAVSSPAGTFFDPDARRGRAHVAAQVERHAQRQSESRSCPTTLGRRITMLSILGLMTGALSGLFGVGGGFVIVPALVLVGEVPIRRAIATSLLVIPLVSASGIVWQLMGREPLDWRVTGLFVAGGVVGMFVGTAACRRLHTALLQKIFAVVIVIVAVFNGLATLYRHH